jgi:methionyl-tRNA synthetase
MTPKRYTVTAALIYANGPIHIGHLAGCYLPADIYVRYLRAKGTEVFFVSGTDEHGVPITLRAQKEGITPQQVVDKYYKLIRDSFADFGISFDVYSRTSKRVHHETSQEFFKKLYDKGVFVEEETEQYYDEKAGQFLADRYIVGTCPNCGNPNAYGDQCERCGSTLSPMELINPHSMLSGEKPVLRKTKNWYLPLDKMQPEIEEYINSHPEWKTNVAGQCQSWLKQGLQPRAMTRDLDWGIKVPLPDTDGKVLYVWFEAPIGYISASKDYFTAKKMGAAPELYTATLPETVIPADCTWETYWRMPGTKLVHFIGKDNIVFHCVIFPAMLMAEGSYILPDNVPANEFMNLEGDKISTSRNWAVWLHEYLQDFPGQQDVLRYVLTANAPETKDSEFTWKDFQTRNNSELADNLGNFINRVVTLTHKYYHGAVPPRGQLYDIDRELIDTLAQAPAAIGEAIENYRFREALSLVMDVSRAGNKYLADTEPWKKAKDDPERVKTVLNLAAQVVANLAVLAEPFMPFTAQKIVRMLGLPYIRWRQAGGVDLIETGQVFGPAEILFSKIEDATIAGQMQKLEAAKKANEAATQAVSPAKEAVSFDDFQKMDIRVGTIVAAEAVPKTQKLLKLTIETGLDTRTVVSGIAEHYKPEEIVGKQVCLLANLTPRPLKGITSQGMILMAEDLDGKLVFVSPESLISNGGTVR